MSSSVTNPREPETRTVSETQEHALSERALHEYVAEVEGHDSQVTGVVGYFYRLYRAEVLDRVVGVDGHRMLEVGCGEGMMFEGTLTHPVQMDVSMTRVARAARKCRFLLCADGYQLPFADDSFEVVLLIAVLEHTREPERILAEARRVLKPGGRAIMVVPNDVTMSAGRLLLRKFPIRYPDHLTFTTPRKMRRWLSHGFRIREAFTLPFRWLPFAANLYYFVVAEKLSGGSGRTVPTP
jgi:SAM-dependent methyltransferase